MPLSQEQFEKLPTEQQSIFQKSEEKNDKDEPIVTYNLRPDEQVLDHLSQYQTKISKFSKELEEKDKILSQWTKLGEFSEVESKLTANTPPDIKELRDQLENEFNKKQKYFEDEQSKIISEKDRLINELKTRHELMEKKTLFDKIMRQFALKSKYSDLIFNQFVNNLQIDDLGNDKILRLSTGGVAAPKLDDFMKDSFIKENPELFEIKVNSPSNLGDGGRMPVSGQQVIPSSQNGYTGDQLKAIASRKAVIV